MFQKKYQKSKREEMIPTGDQLLDTLLYKGHNESYGDIQEDDLYAALQNCKELIQYLPEMHYKKHGKDLFIYDRALSLHQIACANAAIKCIMRKEYFTAISEFSACIDDGGEGIFREININEFALYDSILTCFIEKIKENKGMQQ